MHRCWDLVAATGQAMRELAKHACDTINLELLSIIQ